jgi:hypothetical protein
MAIAFLVEGKMEQMIVQKICKGAPVSMLGLNGRDVSMDALAKRAASLVRLRRQYYPIVIVFDREKRKETCEDLVSQFLGAMRENGVEREDLLVGIPDRMIENWILSCGGVRKDHGLTGSQEGKHGKAELEKALSTKGVDYHKTTVGVEMFSKIDVKSAARNSSSFKSFRAKVKGHCSWLEGKVAARPRRKKS